MLKETPRLTGPEAVIKSHTLDAPLAANLDRLLAIPHFILPAFHAAITPLRYRITSAVPRPMFLCASYSLSHASDPERRKRLIHGGHSSGQRPRGESRVLNIAPPCMLHQFPPFALKSNARERMLCAVLLPLAAPYLRDKKPP